MEINVKISKNMDELGEKEDYYIRIPKILMDSLSVDVDDELTLESLDGGDLPLIVKESFTEDSGLSLRCAYVTTKTNGLLKLNKTIVERVDNLLIGCDPEFFLVHRPSESIINGAIYFSNATNRQVGSDGPLMELRPHPNLDSYKVVENIRNLLISAKKRIISNKHISDNYGIENILMVGSSYYNKLSAGFHVHFGIPPSMLDTSSIDVKTAVNQISNILDYYVGIPSVLPEHMVDSNRRTRTEVSYGKPGDWRLQFPTFEYRVPGGFLLSDPVLTKGLLSMSWVIMDDILARLKICTNNFQHIGILNSSKKSKELYPNMVADRHKIYQVICNYDPKNTAKIVDKIFYDMEEMVSFEKEKIPLINFYNRVMSGSLCTHNIEENWGLRNEPKEMEFHTKSQESITQFA